MGEPVSLSRPQGGLLGGQETDGLWAEMGQDGSAGVSVRSDSEDPWVLHKPPTSQNLDATKREDGLAL